MSSIRETAKPEADTPAAAAAPGSAQGLHLTVSDIDAARAELLARGVDVSEEIRIGRTRTPSTWSASRRARSCHHEQ